MPGFETMCNAATNLWLLLFDRHSSRFALPVGTESALSNIGLEVAFTINGFLGNRPRDEKTGRKYQGVSSDLS